MRLAAASLLLIALVAGAPLLHATAETDPFVRQYPYQAGPFTLPLDEDRHDDLLGWPGQVMGTGHGTGLIEWWYNVLHLQAEDGHRFGIMASWLWYGSFSTVVSEVIFDVTDVDGQRFWPNDEFDGDLNLSAPAGRLDLTIGPSSLRQTPGAPFEYDLHAVGARTEARLHMVATEAPFTPHGGSLVMGALDTAATRSWYYTLPRLALTGELVVDGALYHVTGTGGMDHEWYPVCSCTPRNDWDYFNLRLDNGAHVVAYDFFDTDRVQTLRYDARLPDGSHVSEDDFGFTPLGFWQKQQLGSDPQDPVGMATSKLYTHGWRFDLPAADLHLTVQPLVQDQETHRGALVPDRFYEGESSVAGTWHGEPVQGLAFAEIWHDSRLDVPHGLK